MTLVIQYLEVNDIVLDCRNPRVAPALESLEGDPAQEFIEMALGQYAPDDSEKPNSTTFSSLKGSIRAYQGLINPMVVTQREDGKFLVIEGNTRVSIFRQLAKEGAPGDWTKIPAMVRTELEEEGEHAIRLQSHLVGPRDWRPYAKAKYLHMLYTEKKISITQILDYCGGSARKREIEEWIYAYIDMQDHYMAVIGDNPPDYTRFSAFVEVQKPGIKEAITKAKFTMTDFAKWVHESKIHPLSTVRQIPRVLAHPEARKKFLAYNAREAMKVLEQPSANSALKEATIDQLAQAITSKIRSLNYSDIQGLKESNSSIPAQIVLECYEELRDLCKMTGMVTENE